MTTSGTVQTTGTTLGTVLETAAARDARERNVPHHTIDTTTSTDVPPVPRPFDQLNRAPPPSNQQDSHRNLYLGTEMPIRYPVFDLGKKLAELHKLYDSSMRYKAEMFDVFDTKLMIFNDTC